MKNNKIGLISSTALFTIIILLSGCNKSPDTNDATKQTSTAIQLIPADIINVQSGSLADEISFTGTIRPIIQTTIQAQVSDTVLSVNTNIGQHVKKGQTLVVLNNQDNHARLNQAKANLSTAEAQSALNHSLMERKKRLLDQGFISRLEYEQSQLEYRAQLETVKAQKANVDIANKASQQAIINSPISGYVTLRQVDVGQTVSVGQTLFEIIDPSKLEIKGNISASDQSQLHLGQNIQFKIQGNSTIIDAKITRITPVIDPLSRNLEFYAQPIQSIQHLSVGAFVEGKVIPENTVDGLIIPLRSIQDIESNPYVWLIRNHKIEKMSIKVIDIKQQQEQAIISGLDIGDQLSLVKFQEKDIGRQVSFEE